MARNCYRLRCWCVNARRSIHKFPHCDAPFEVRSRAWHRRRLLDGVATLVADTLPDGDSLCRVKHHAPTICSHLFRPTTCWLLGSLGDHSRHLAVKRSLFHPTLKSVMVHPLVTLRIPFGFVGSSYLVGSEGKELVRLAERLVNFHFTAHNFASLLQFKVSANTYF